MRTHSNVFSQTMGPGMLKDELNLNRKKKNLSATRGGFSLAHDEGQFSKMDWPSKKTGVTDKPNQ